MFLIRLLPKAAILQPIFLMTPCRMLHNIKKGEYLAKATGSLTGKASEEAAKQREAPISFKLLAEIVGKKVDFFSC